MDRVVKKGIYMNNLVSIVVPIYNCEAFIAETIESVLNQTYKNWELILVDDASTDGSANIIRQYLSKDARIFYYKLEKNSGPAVATNRAIEKAKGSYIAFLDSDDLWHKEKLEKQLHFMDVNNIVFSCTSYEQITENGDRVGKIIKSIPKADYRRILLDNPVGTLAVMYNASLTGKIYGPDIRKRNDYALWLKMLKKIDYIYGMPEVLAFYRIRKNSLSRNKLVLVKYHWKVYREFEQLSVLKSLFHIIYWIIIKILRIK